MASASVKINLTSVVRVPETVAFHDLDGEAVLLNFDTGKYYGLDEVGTRMFHLLREQGKPESVCQVLLQEYDVTQEQLQGDVIKLIETLVARGLLTIDVA